MGAQGWVCKEVQMWRSRDGRVGMGVQRVVGVQGMGSLGRARVEAKGGWI